jgi:hypothetical protein
VRGGGSGTMVATLRTVKKNAADHGPVTALFRWAELYSV